MTSITIPNSVKELGNDAFARCESLTNITIPNGVTTIGERAFWLCRNLKSISIPNCVKSIERSAFFGCTQLSRIIFTGTKEQWKAIKKAEGWDSETGKYTVKFVDGEGSANSAASQPKSNSSTLENYDKDEFEIAGTVLKRYKRKEYYGEVKIPLGVTSIRNQAFSSCHLTDISIPNSVTSIGSRAFEFCGDLKKITIPSSVTSIGDGVFFFCRKLKDIYYGGTVKQWKVICKAVSESAYKCKHVVHCTNGDFDK